MADLIASIAIWIDPSVPFLNPIGAERPEASCLCIWLSVVLAPIAPQLIRSPIYWGVMGSKNSLPRAILALKHPLAIAWQALILCLYCLIHRDRGR